MPASATALKTYTHPLGLVFQYPADWIVRESPFTDFELVPPIPAKNERGPTESYFLMTFGIKATDGSDPKLTEQIEALLKQVAPFLTPAGDTEPLSSPAHGVLMRWRGTSPSGINAQANVYSLPGAKLSYCLISLGEASAIESREQAIEDIFRTFQSQNGSTDPKIIGNWKNAEDKSSMSLAADGRFSATQSSSGEQTQTSNTASEPADKNQTTDGYWFAGEGKLYLVPVNATTLSFSYQLKGKTGLRTLTLHHASGQEQVLQEVKSKKSS